MVPSNPTLRRRGFAVDLGISLDELDRFVEEHARFLLPRELNVIRQLYGIGQDMVPSRQKVAEELGLSAQIVARLLKTATRTLQEISRETKNVPSDPREQTVSQFFSRRRAALARTSVRTLHLLKQYLQSGFVGDDPVGNDPKISEIISHSADEIAKIFSIQPGSRSFAALTAMLALEKLHLRE